MEYLAPERQRRRLIATAAAISLTLLVAGCGSSSHGRKTTSSVAAAASTPTATTPPPPPPHLHIVFPRPGARTGRTLTVRVAVTGARAHRLLYLLDRVETRRGPTRLTFTELLPGLHHVLVMLASDRSVRAATSFTVPAPPPPAPAPAPAAAPPPMTTSRIPQNNGGDMDGDNNGAPSDGDGNV